MLRTRPKLYAPIDQDSVRSVLARTRDVGEVSRSLASDLLVTIRMNPLPHDSAMMLIQVYDLTAANPFRSRTAATRPGPKNEVLGGLDNLLFSTITYLDEMTRSPRRPATPPPPPSNQRDR
jgi:hypothetical protein